MPIAFIEGIMVVGDGRPGVEGMSANFRRQGDLLIRISKHLRPYSISCQSSRPTRRKVSVRCRGSPFGASVFLYPPIGIAKGGIPTAVFTHVSRQILPQNSVLDGDYFHDNDRAPTCVHSCTAVSMTLRNQGYTCTIFVCVLADGVRAEASTSVQGGGGGTNEAVQVQARELGRVHRRASVDRKSITSIFMLHSMLHGPCYMSCTCTKRVSVCDVL